jgi:hypothetical protein
MDAINVGNKLVAHFWRANPGQFSRVPKEFRTQSELRWVRTGRECGAGTYIGESR